MYERKIEEHAQVLSDSRVVAAVDRHSSKVPRKRIGGEHVRGAMAVARELVEQHHERQRTLGGVGPMIKLASGGREMQRFEANMKIGVKERLFYQPSVDASATPERIDRSDARIKVGHVP